MRKVSPCPVCEMEFSCYKEYELHFETEHSELQRAIWRTKKNHRQRRTFDQRMKQDEKVCKKILRQHIKGSHTQQEFDQRLEKLQEKMKDSEEKMKDSEELFNLVQA